MTGFIGAAVVVPHAGERLVLVHPEPRIGVERVYTWRRIATDPDFTAKCTELHKSKPSANRPKLLLTDRNQDAYPYRNFVFSTATPNRRPHK
jgi:hypothetical protein